MSMENKPSSPQSGVQAPADPQPKAPWQAPQLRKAAISQRTQFTIGQLNDGDGFDSQVVDGLDT